MILYCSKFLFFKIEDMEEEKKNIDEFKFIIKDILVVVVSELKLVEFLEVRKLYLFIQMYFIFFIDLKSNYF